MFTQLIIGFITELICAVTMQGRALASNHTRILFLSLSLSTCFLQFVTAASLEKLSFTQRQPMLSVCFLPRVGVCSGMDVWLNYWCSVNPIWLVAGATCAVCYVCVFGKCVWDIVGEEEGAVL